MRSRSAQLEDGQPLWPPDSPVHLKAVDYLVLAEEIVQQDVFGSSSDDIGQPGKRVTSYRQEAAARDGPTGAPSGVCGSICRQNR